MKLKKTTTLVLTFVPFLLSIFVISGFVAGQTRRGRLQEILNRRNQQSTDKSNRLQEITIGNVRRSYLYICRRITEREKNFHL